MNFYKLLGVAPDAPFGQIRAYYRLLVRATHPDVTRSSDASEFMRYTEAYRNLASEEKRRSYNAQFGIALEPRPLKPGYDLHQRITISRNEGLAGGLFPLAFKRYEPCARCWLAGCAQCAGYGQVLEQVTVEVRVPAGTQRPRTIFIEGSGGVSEPGGKRGDLLVYVSIKESL